MNCPRSEFFTFLDISDKRPAKMLRSCWSLRLAGESSNSSASILVSACKAGVFSSVNDVFYNVLPPSWTLTEFWGESKKDSKREQAILVCRVGSPL